MLSGQSSKRIADKALSVLCSSMVLCGSMQAFATDVRPVANTNMCLDVAGGSGANGTAVQIAKCNTNQAQNWTFTNNTVRVMGNKCLDVPDANTAAGTKLQIWDCNGRANQTFTVSGQMIQWTPGKMCVDIPYGNATDGARLQTYSCHGGNPQNWQIGGAQTASAPASSGAWKLVWSDEFNGNALDRSKWNVEVNCNGGGNNEQQCYVDSTNNISVADGLLTLKVIKQNYNGKPYTSGRINTSNKAHWTYGRFESRIKVPCGQGLWPAAWMLPEPNAYGTWPTSGELDIMEILGGKANTLYGTAHFGKPWPNQLQLGGTSVLGSGNYCGDFHVFAMEWSSTQATWFVDGKAYYTLKNTDGAWSPLNHWPFDQNFFFILNLAMGGDWPGAPDASIQDGMMQVDYVRAYSH